VVGWLEGAELEGWGGGEGEGWEGGYGCVWVFGGIGWWDCGRGEGVLWGGELGRCEE
jgi:hypothetical protein